MRKICFITGTRSDYGIMAPIMHLIEESDKAILQIIATNAHLSPDFGMTVKQIEDDGFRVDARIASLVSGSTPESTVRSMAKVQEGLSVVLPDLRPDLVVILGDRYEALAAASATVVFGIPIAHLHGGETSEGAIDDLFRHAITKLSTLHFAATPGYARRIVKMGESPERVFHSGAPGAEPDLEQINSSLPGFYEKTGLNRGDRFIMVGMHPVTVLPDSGRGEMESLLEALKPFIEEDYKILFTMPNSDPGNTELRNQILKFREGNKGVFCVESLGSRLYHAAMTEASVLVGNTSSALIEAPACRLPSVNVGIRQKGREHGAAVLDAYPDKTDITEKIRTALSPQFRDFVRSAAQEEINPYFKPSSVRFIAETLINAPLPATKPFFDG
ncbi:MAG: UDP-N-acetylglucosamine 2-epimerase (hydrolyzing) [Muribaculaceae bacterium]|nr:UDP-N-acetylglucosamine 2-epimerase (hydrolyzing) [Muribaculaceae bacterium]